jgi:isoaspartyl peptidase/L-asparaginase-like protein (Ntn-hydrolase superfamily)
MAVTRYAIALHGGSGAKRGHDYGQVIDHMRGLVENARDRLRNGASALDVAVETVAALESSGLYIAGRGASPNLAGVYELDACLMDGATGRAGAVAALTGIESPIRTARAVMERTRHVLLVGAGAAQFASTQRLATVPDPGGWYTRACAYEFSEPSAALSDGTVGCVARDVRGDLAAATSSGGTPGKLPGRVGDSAHIGASTWADEQVALSCTGDGEFFIRSAAAAQIAHRMRFARQTLDSAAADVLEDIVRQGGAGGLVAIDHRGNVAMPFVSTEMK